MKYLLDTDICIYLIKKRPSAVIDRLRRCQTGDAVVSSITVAELRYGASKSQGPEQNHEALNLFLAPFDLLMFDHRAAQAYGEIRAQVERAGTPTGPLDLLIAAQARSANLTLVTNNTNEFGRVKGLRVEDWV